MQRRSLAQRTLEADESLSGRPPPSRNLIVAEAPALSELESLVMQIQSPKPSTIPGKSYVAAPVDAPASTPIKDEAPAKGSVRASIERFNSQHLSPQPPPSSTGSSGRLNPALARARSAAQLRPALPPGLPPGVGAPSASRPPAAALHAGASPPAALVASGGGVSSEQRRQLRCSQSFTASTFTAPQQARAPAESSDPLLGQRVVVVGVTADSGLNGRGATVVGRDPENYSTVRISLNTASSSDADGKLNADGTRGWQPNLATMPENNLRTLLYFAASNGIWDTVSAEINSGLSQRVLDWVDTVKGRSAIWSAAFYGEQRCVELLAAAKASVNLRNTSGFAPLWVATQRGHDSCVQTLLASKAAVDLPNLRGTTPLMAAAMHGHHLCAKLLIDARAELGLTQDGLDALAWAHEKNQPKCASVIAAAMQEEQKRRLREAKSLQRMMLQSDEAANAPAAIAPQPPAGERKPSRLMRTVRSFSSLPKAVSTASKSAASSAKRGLTRSASAGSLPPRRPQAPAAAGGSENVPTPFAAVIQQNPPARPTAKGLTLSPSFTNLLNHLSPRANSGAAHAASAAAAAEAPAPASRGLTLSPSFTNLLNMRTSAARAAANAKQPATPGSSSKRAKALAVAAAANAQANPPAQEPVAAFAVTLEVEAAASSTAPPPEPTPPPPMVPKPPPGPMPPLDASPRGPSPPGPPPTGRSPRSNQFVNRTISFGANGGGGPPPPPPPLPGFATMASEQNLQPSPSRKLSQRTMSVARPRRSSNDSSSPSGDAEPDYGGDTED